MTLNQGARLGPYEIVGFIGAGGMGEVYKARDTRLDRTVAIKVLPSAISDEPDRRARFEREARTIATLSHPHICTLHDVGEQARSLFLVMEHLAGETLADRLHKGALPIDQALEYGAQIADALAAAHRSGVVHRDLKPANIMLTKSGVKLLDFGLAKARANGDVAAGISAMETVAGDLTAQGTILGTFQYMAPEQLEGLAADPRTDIFAFGAVLYEMITGTKAFQGKTQASVIGAIMQRDPPAISGLRADSPALLDHLVARCLAKNPDDRWQSAGDVMRELLWLRQSTATAAAAETGRPQPTPASWRRAAYGLGLLAVLLAGVLAYVILETPVARHGASAAEPSIRIVVTPPPNTRLSSVQLAISPDGGSVAYIGLSGDQRQVWVYSLASGESRSVAGTEGSFFPFWSADSQRVAFVSRTTLMRVSANGGPAQVLAPANDQSSGSWGDDSTILFTGSDPPRICRVPAGGGRVVPVTSLDPSRGDIMHLHPRYLPGGKRFLYFVRSRTPEYTGIYIRSLDVDDHRMIVQSPGNAEYIAPGYLLFTRDAVLYAQRFDLSRLQFEGEPVPVAKQVNVNFENGAAAISAARNGSLLMYARAEAPGALKWVDRQGSLGDTLSPRAVYRGVELSPDGREALGKIRGKDVGTAGDVWKVDLSRGINSRLTADALSMNARWSRDGQYVFFDSARPGAAGIYRKRSDGTGPEELIWKTEGTLSDVSSDGRLLVQEGQTCTSVQTGGASKASPFLTSASLNACGRFNDDGRFVAYDLRESGHSELYVAPFPQGSPRLQVSSGGGREPRWRKDGKELFYVAPDGRIMSVAISLTPTLEAAQPRALFSAITLTSGPFAEYSVAPDAQHFLMILPFEDARTESFTIITHWSSTLRQ